jgi:hypothetical protein
VNKFLRTLLKTSVRLLEQSDRVLAAIDNNDRSAAVRTRASILIHDERVVNLMSFAAGIGLGVGVGLLVAPASGKQTRGTVLGKVHAFGDRARERFSNIGTNAVTGTDSK